MPLFIIRQDITKMSCDAIVNPSNRFLIPGGGADAAIHKAAGSELTKLCATLGGVEVGEVKVTPAFNLPCKYIIHTAGPIWRGGQNNEEALLKNCYVNALNAALTHGCETIAIPLISTGTFNYPKDQVLQVAMNAICPFLLKNELTAYLVVFSKKAYEYSSKLFKNITSYIDDNYVEEYLNEDESGRENNCERRECEESASNVAPKNKEASLKDMLSSMDESFAVTLMKLIDEKGMEDVECYKKANVAKQTWYKILNDDTYRPSKTTVISFAIALELSLDETQHLLATVGFTLSKSRRFDVIIEYFISQKNYNVFDINETLFHFDQELLGV